MDPARLRTYWRGALPCALPKHSTAQHSTAGHSTGEGVSCPFPSERHRYGPGLAGLIDAGRALSATEYQHILLRRCDFAGRVAAALTPVDAMLIPAQPIAAPTVARMTTLGRVPAELAALIRYTAPFDMSGNPTLTLPVAFTGAGLPIAAQFVGKPLGEAVIVRTGRAFQRVTDFHRRHPRV